MSEETYRAFIEKHRDVFHSLSERRIFFITGLVSGGPLDDENLIGYNGSRFSDYELLILERLINSRFISNYRFPLLIDAPKAVSLFKMAEGTDQSEESVLLLSRLSFMGTDGMRGKVSVRSSSSYVSDFAGKNLMTPELIKLSSYAYSKMLLYGDYIKPGDRVCVGNDGRDITTDWALNKAMIEGFRSSGLNVCDIGVNPTPYVPWKMLKSRYRAGAMLTASHNPANQNGIKFFLDGKKNLPEGELGDYSFAGWMYFYYLKGIHSEGKTILSEPDIRNAAETLLLNAVPSDLSTKLDNAFIVLDNAGGAYGGTSGTILEKLNLDYVCINENPTGHNINKACGVAEIEGMDNFPPENYESYLPVVRQVFDQGRRRDCPVYGVVLDGDGDRGFILYYDKKNDTVYTIDGDKSGYIIARYLIQSRSLEAEDFDFVLTVESDLMTAYHAEKTLGLNTSIVSVGDKWIGAYKGGRLLLGLESSGHLILPLTFENDNGESVELLSGNGLLTCLMVLTAIGELKLTGKEIREPYEPGYSMTHYTYFVDKTLFFNGSPMWKSDRKIIERGFEKLKTSGILGCSSILEFEVKEDAHMLYGSFRENGAQIASIFCRNSGTEDKTAVYIKCKEEMAALLNPIGEDLKMNHLKNMKNRNRIECRCEEIIVESLSDRGELTLSGLKTILDENLDAPMSDADLYSVVYALKKEGRAIVEEDRVSLMKVMSAL